MAQPAPYASTLAADAARVTELAAIASYAGIGRGDEKAADQLPVPLLDPDVAGEGALQGAVELAVRHGRGRHAA